MNSSTVLSKTVQGSRAIHVKGSEHEGDGDKVEPNDDEDSKADNRINSISSFSAVDKCNHYNGEISKWEERLETMENINKGKNRGELAPHFFAGGGEDLVVDVLSSIKEEDEDGNNIIKGGDDGVANNADGDGKVTTFKAKNETPKTNYVRCIKPEFKIMEVDPQKSVGAKLLGTDFRHKYYLFLSDPYNFYSVLALVGACMGFLGVLSTFPDYCGGLALLAIPSLVMSFMSMNNPLLRLLSVRFFTILKGVYIFVSISSIMVLFRERTNSWGPRTFFIVAGMGMLFWGLMIDSFYLPFREKAMKRCSTFISVILGIFIVLLHTGSLDVSDYKLEFMGHFNFSLVSLMVSAMYNLFLLNFEIVYISFTDPKRLVTLFSPIISVKDLKKSVRLMRSANASSKREEPLFPPEVTSLTDKIIYVRQKIEENKEQVMKVYSILNEGEKKEVDNYKINKTKIGRKTEKMGNQLETLMQFNESGEEKYVITCSFPIQEVDSSDTLGKVLFGPKAAKILGGPVSFLFVFINFVGTGLFILAVNKVIPDYYMLAVFFCIPVTLNLLQFNVFILRKLILQIEVMLLMLSAFCFCLCGAILLRNREYNWCYFLFFITLWIASQILCLGDSLPGSSRQRQVVIGSVTGSFVYIVVLICLYYDKLDGQDFVISFFGSLNVTISNQCASSGIIKKFK